MSDRTVLAVPSLGAGGLEAERSGHFGHCPCFTLVDIVDGELAGVRIIENVEHVQGGCLTPVNMLASHGVTALLAAGMGARPLQGFNDAGITVYYETETPVVGDAVQRLLAGGVPTMDLRNTCAGH